MAKRGPEFKKKGGPYRGVVLILLCLFSIPVLAHYFIGWRIAVFEHISPEMTYWETAAFTGLVGTATSIVVLLAGGLREYFPAVKTRLSSFRLNLAISFKDAVRWYFEDLREYGIAFWIVLGAMLLNLAYLLYGMIGFLKLTGFLH